ncbi:MAG: ABC transporter ATP-binding protein [Haloarculaceae archaeon]
MSDRPPSTQSSSVPSTPQPDTEPAVVCESVSREYRRGRDGGTRVVALDDVSLSVAPGTFLAVTGPSGSGKSTLLHLLAALDTPSSGRVLLAGTDTAAASERRRTRLRLDHVGVVFQRFHLLPSLSARSNVALPLIERGVPKRERHERAEDLLSRVGLGDRVDHRPGELSGGEQQRVAVARALVNDPDLLVADEPTGELDSETGRVVLDLLGAVAEDRAVVVASHDPAVGERADRHLALLDGRRVGGDE